MSNPTGTATFWFWQAGHGQNPHWAPFLGKRARLSRRLKKTIRRVARKAAERMNGARGQRLMAELYAACVQDAPK
jgi:hypothetical protein